MVRFSVVIAVYNKEKHIAKTLQSVLDQTYPHFEVVIVNDGSTDQSEAVIKSFTDPRITYYRQDNKGAGAARNAAIEKAKFDHIALLDADDYWYPYYLQEQRNLILKYPDECVFATNSEICRNGKIFSRNYSVPINKNSENKFNYFKASYLDSILHSSSTVIKKAVFDEIGYYNPNIKSGQDTDLYVRLGLNYDVIFSSRVCSRYFINSDSLFHTTANVTDKANFEAYEVYESTNSSLKKFLDLNRYSHCILAKLSGDDENYKKFFRKIDLRNLNKKQVFLLRQNRKSLRLLLKFKDVMSDFGVRLSAFK
jgi:glycosyltransferase involved in cell wall biosynthesis